MSTDKLILEVATPKGLALRTEVESVEAPSVKGEFGVFPGHLPLLAALRCGPLTYHAGGKNQVIAIGPGFIEAEADRVTVLTDMVALKDDVDKAAVQKELEAAQKRLAEFGELHQGPEYEERQREIDWAFAQLGLLEH